MAARKINRKPDAELERLYKLDGRVADHAVIELLARIFKGGRPKRSVLVYGDGARGHRWPCYREGCVLGQGHSKPHRDHQGRAYGRMPRSMRRRIARERVAGEIVALVGGAIPEVGALLGDRPVMAPATYTITARTVEQRERIEAALARDRDRRLASRNGWR